MTKQIAAKSKELKSLVTQLDYLDPATAEARPQRTELHVELFDDAVPAGSTIFASPGHPTNYVGIDKGKVFSGQKALKRTSKGLAQDVIEKVTDIAVPSNGKVYVHVYIDPEDVPKTLMIQYHSSGWLHRAVWGDYDAIQWGTTGTTERVRIGDLPKPGE